MLKKRKIKAMYMKVAICNKCGSPMESTGMVLSTWPEQYPYKCMNENCDGYETFWGNDRPGQIAYEFEEEKDADFNKLQNQAVARVKNKEGITYLKKKLTVPTKICPHCSAHLEGEAMITPRGETHLIYDCPNNCKLTFAESNEFLSKDNKDVISYEEEVDVCTTLLP